MTLNKMHGLGLIFTMLVVVLIVSPSTINNIYNNILGRVGLIALIIFFAMHNVTLGLLTALCVIIASNMSMVEGFDTASIGTGQNIDPSLLGTGQNISEIKAQLQAAQANQSATSSSSTTSSTSPTTSTTATPAPSTTATATPTNTSSTTPSTNSSTTSSTPSTSSSTYTMPSFTTTLTKRINNGTTTGSTTTGSNTTGSTTTGTNSNGVDRQSVQQALQSTSSNSMPVNKGMFRSDEVAPSSTESFGCMGAPY